MNEYSPFLKLKNGELNALSKLSPEDRQFIIPLLELPRDDKCTTEEHLINKIDRNAKKIKKGIKCNFTFYIDNYEIPDEIKINGVDNYQYLINSFFDFDIIPVVGFDRVSTHNDIAINYANKKSKKIALRITQDYFENFLAYKNDLQLIFNKINSDVFHILLLDCNYIENNLIDSYKISVINILENIIKSNIFSKIVIAGSSIPALIGNIVKVNTNALINRNEVSLFKAIKAKYNNENIIFGDYTIVSPEYSELNIKEEYLPNLMTPKIIYTLIDSQYFTRGRGLKEYGFSQYFKQANDIIKKQFFRGKNFSWGDNFLYEKAINKGTNITPSSIIGPTVNAHLKYMIEEINKGTI